MSRTRSVRLDWKGDGLVFEGAGASGVPVPIDSDSAVGTTPMEALLLAFAGCMAVDVVMILEKSRVPLNALSIVAEGDRAETVPKRFEALRLIFEIEGPGDDDWGKVDRAVDLSRDRYCSVFHTLRPDIDLSIVVKHG